MSEWQEYNIGDLCDGIYDGPHATPKKTDLGPIFLGISNLSGGRIDLSNAEHLSEESFKKWTRRIIPQANDVVFSYETRLGEAALIPNGLRCCLGRRMALMRPNLEKVDPQFLLYAFLSPSFQETICARTIHGSTVNRIALTEFPSYPLKIPSLTIQKNISSTLHNLDAKIENLRSQNQTLEKIAQTLFNYWFIDFEFPNEFGEPYKSSGGEMVTSELGDIPVGWRVGKIGDEVETLGGGTPSTTESSYWEAGEIPWYSPTDLTRQKTLFSIDSEKKITSLGLQKSSAKLFSKYSLLLTSRATIGEVTINTKEACTNQGFITIIPNQAFSIYFLHRWLLTQIDLIKMLASGSTFPEISKTNFRSIDFLVPAKEVLKEYDILIQPIYKKMETNIFQIQTLTKTRNILLPKLMSGQIRVAE